MAIYKRENGGYMVRVSLAKDAETGKYGRFNRVCRTYKEARAVEAQVKHESDKGTFAEPSEATVGEYLTSWLEARRPTIRPRTHAGYSYIVATYIVPALGTAKLAQLSKLQVEKFRNELAARVSPATVRYAMVLLKGALSHAVDAGDLARNVALKVAPPKRVRHEMACLVAAEVRSFLAEVSEPIYRALFTLAVMTGMRPGEQLGLKWSDCDLDKGTASVQRSLWHPTPNEWTLTEPKTARSRRSVRLLPPVVRELRKWKAAQAANRLARGGDYEDNGLVFAREDGRPLYLPTVIRRTFRPALLSAGLVTADGEPKIRYYDLRHSYATVALAAGVHPKVVADNLGHSSIRETLDTYSHVTEGLVQESASRLAEAFAL